MEAQTEALEIAVPITTEDSDKETVVTEHSHSQEDSVIQILNRDLITTHSQTIIMEVSDLMMEVSDQAEVLTVAVVLEAALQAAAV